MKSLMLFVVLLAAFADAEGSLKVRFDMGEHMGVNYFIALPTTLAEAEAAAWVLTSRPDGPMPSLYMYCYPDRVVCVLFDDTDYIAGLQIALPVEQWSDYEYDMQATGFTLWTPSVPFWIQSRTYWAIQQYYVNEEILRQPKEIRLASRRAGHVIQNGGLWVTGVGRELLRIPDNTAEMDNSIFTKQACIPWMGQHYYHNMTTASSCAEPLYPWFSMTDGPDLVATGFLVLGRLNKPDTARMWFETPEAEVVRAIVPNGPQCLYAQTQNPGTLTMHIYYIEEPWQLQC